MKSKVHSIKVVQNDVVDGIIKNDPETFNLIYHEQFGKIKSMVNNFKYINLEPEDVFQEGLTRAVINIRRGSFNGNSLFSTYLYGICRNLCLKEYNRSKLLTTNEIGDIKEEVQDDYFDSIQLMLKLKEKLDNNCKTIIDLRFGIGNTDNSITRFETIAKKLRISVDNTRQRFRRCMLRLKKLVTNNPMFNQLMD